MAVVVQSSPRDKEHVAVRLAAASGTCNWIGRRNTLMPIGSKKDVGGVDTDWFVTKDSDPAFADPYLGALSPLHNTTAATGQWHPRQTKKAESSL